jgi:hypothetical protein
VQGKLAGYTWNLTDEYVFAVDVTEIARASAHALAFAARDRFERARSGTTARTARPSSRIRTSASRPLRSITRSYPWRMPWWSGPT